MPFIDTFSINTEKHAPFPFNIPAVKFARNITLDQRVTIFVGDNGSGKSTLLESIAYNLKIPLIGGHITSAASFEAARLLQPFVDIKWRRQTKKGFFFRAEDFSDFVNAVERQQSKIRGQISELEGEVDESIIKQMTESMNYALHETRKTYGDDMQAYSHGEAFFSILQNRIVDKGVFLLDEPEAALSPLKQLALIAFILEVLKSGNIQILIATHSPILMGIPGAKIYEVQEDGMGEVAYRDTDHYRITKTFLDNPDFYLRHF